MSEIEQITCIHILANRTTKTKTEEISLDLLAKYYEQYLMVNDYEYTIYDANNTKLLLKPLSKNFPHLVGMGQIAEKRYGKGNPKVYQFTGKDGYKGAKNGRITFSRLESLSSTKFHDCKKKFEFFHFIHKLLNKPYAVKYVVKVRSVQADFLFYSEIDGALVHIGAVEESSGAGYYVPNTFMVTYMSSKTAKEYIENQTPFSIKEVKIIPRSGSLATIH